MPSATLTVLTSETSTEVEADIDGERVVLDRDALLAATGWELKPEGLCRDDACVPLRDGDDLAAVAAALRLPLAMELDAGVVALGEAAHERAAAMASLDAPAFTLEGVSGGTISLDDFAGRKRMLLAWASW